MKEEVKPRPIVAWIRAMRLPTLKAGISPVIVGTALAFVGGKARWEVAVLCLLVAICAQVASNFANDYYDWRKGSDTAQRLGPARAVASGWIEPETMKKAAFWAVAASCAFGICLLWFSSWWLVFVGAAICLGVWSYSSGPLPLSRVGLGDVAVLLFFGVVPVCFTYYVQAGSFSLESLAYGIALGLTSANILVVNNYRDYAEDKLSGKLTLIVRFGRGFGRGFFLANGLVAVLLTVFVSPSALHGMEQLCLLCLMIAMHMRLFTLLGKKTGHELNSVLKKTAIYVFAFALYQVFLLIS